MKAVRLLGLLVFLCAMHAESFAQKERNNKSDIKNVKQAAESLKKSLSEDDELAIAENYEKLAKELTEKGDYVKAEEYLKQANEIYTRLKNKQKSSIATRGIAQNQEAQLKTNQAIENYHVAAAKSSDTIVQRLNLNDAGRLSNKNPTEQQRFTESNISILQEQGDKAEISKAYKNLAESQLKQKDTRGAVRNFENALDNSSSPKEVASLTKKIADVFVADNAGEEAIRFSRAAVEKAAEQNDTYLQVDMLLELGKLYEKNNIPDSAEKIMQEAYALSRKLGNTFLAQTSVQALSALYEKQGKDKKRLELYQSFTANLDSMIKTDSSLIDAKLFEMTEGRIKELEKEKQLQAELIDRKNIFNYFLGGSVALLMPLLFFIIKSRNAVNNKNKKIALQSLRREMNPHFIFNSLNSVNQYIARNDEMEANRFLTSYSGLMRTVMEHSGKDFITLNTEIEQLKKYLDLEHQRFKDKFDYTLWIDDAIDVDAIMVPNMIIQPNLENAVWHGLRYREGKGNLALRIEKAEDKIRITITDDGIGLAKSKLLKTEHQKTYQSRGLTNTKERIALLNDIYKTNIEMTIEERSDGSSGTIVEIKLPVIQKNHDTV